MRRGSCWMSRGEEWDRAGEKGRGVSRRRLMDTNRVMAAVVDGQSNDRQRAKARRRVTVTVSRKCGLHAVRMV